MRRTIVILMLSAGCGFGFWKTGIMRPPVEPEWVEARLDSLLDSGDPERELTRAVEDSLCSPDERVRASTLLAAFHNRREEPARALLVLFYTARELDREWTPGQSLVAAEAYYRLGSQEWAEASLNHIPYTNSMTELVQTLRIYGDFEAMKSPDSLVEIRSRFERMLERSSDPMALMLSLHGLGLCYIAKGTSEAYDTAVAYLSFAMNDTAAAYLSFALKEYRAYSKELPLARRLLPYSLYWQGKASVHRGDGWAALEAYEEIFHNYPEAVFWEDASIQYAALQLRRYQTDSVKIISNLYLENTKDPHKALEARLLLASAAAYEAQYDSAAVAFAALSRSLEIGDTLRVLSHAGMVVSLLEYSRSVPEPESIPDAITHLNLSGYNPMAISEVNSEIAERFLVEGRLDEADTFFRRSLRYYPDPIIETRSRLALAYIAFARGEYTNTIDNYEKVLELVERYKLSFRGLADVQLNMGLAYLQRSKSSEENSHADLRKARSSLKEAVQLDPGGEAGELARKRLAELER